VFLFAGSPGVGKTFLAETFAETINLPYKRFDMAAYSGNHALEGLVGFERTWNDSAEGVMTSFVYRNPKCVLLFDEIEKAAPQVILNFLQILDDGHCIDKKLDINVSFQEAIIIFTTNAGRKLYEGAYNKELSSLSSKKILDALVNDINPLTKEPYFPTAIASRMSSYTVLMFNHLKAADIIKVAQKDISNIAKMNSKKFGLRMTGLDILAPTVLFSLGGNVDARNASKKAGQFMDHELYRFLSLSNRKNLNVQNMKGIKWSVDLSDASNEVKEIYQGYKDGVIALFTHVPIEESLLLENNNIKLLATSDKDEFIRIVENEDIIFAVVDYTYGIHSKKQLSIADYKSLGREVCEFIKEENPELDIFFLEKEENPFTEQERKELQFKDASGFLSYRAGIISSEAVEEIYQKISYQKVMEKMFAHHQVLTFDTEHYLNEHSGIGEIRICNLQIETVISADDENEFIGNDVMPNVHWDDIRVSEKLKDELKFFVDYLKNPKEFKKTGLKPPKGVLLYGPPGTGKTSLAKVVATESGINFIAVGADELKGGGPEKIEELFRTARKYAPTVLFIDEIDAIGLDRAKTGMNSALNRLLIEMDGFKKVNNKPVFVMAATNLGDDIDPALGRRFDQKVEVPLPDKEDRKWLFHLFMNKYKDAFSEVTEAQIDALVVRSEYLSPAHIEKVVDKTYREAIRRNVKVTDAIMDDTFEQALFGDVKKDITITDLQQTATHEAGHVICDYISSGNIPNYMTIIGRGDFGGYMIAGENQKKHLSKQDFLNKICCLLGGRAAEIVFYGDEGLSPGISKDIKDATYYAQNMVCSWAMYGDEVGLSVIPLEQLHYHAKATDLVNRILAEQMERAINIVRENSQVIESFVKQIMASDGKSLTKKEISEILER
jgi:ATP-dependent Zn protease